MSIGIPSWRSSSLSRSNIFSNASSLEPSYRRPRMWSLSRWRRATSSMMNRFISRSLLRIAIATPPRVLLQRPTPASYFALVRRQHIDDKHQGRVRRDAVALLLVAIRQVRRDHQFDPAADRHADQG